MHTTTVVRTQCKQFDPVMAHCLLLLYPYTNEIYTAILLYSLDHDLTNQNEQIVVVIFLEQGASCDQPYLPLMSTGLVCTGSCDVM